MRGNIHGSKKFPPSLVCARETILTIISALPLHICYYQSDGSEGLGDDCEVTHGVVRGSMEKNNPLREIPPRILRYLLQKGLGMEVS